MTTPALSPLPWTPMEFDNLLTGIIKANPAAEGLRLGRLPRDVTDLWNTIHRYHTQPASSTLSPMMRHRLEASQGQVRCAVCQTTF